uniref:Protein Wnt n=1 Tax=Lutzomyia longipalpis TaxID=7200 RepID=A0A1B0EZB1_LUTLO
MNLTIDESNGVTLNRNTANVSPSTNAIDNVHQIAQQQTTGLLGKQRLLSRIEIITPSPPTSTPSATQQLLGTIERASTIKTEYITSASISNVYDREIRIIEEIPPAGDQTAGGDHHMAVNDRKYIIPMALKQQHNTKEPRKSSIFRDSATTTNIDDLKRHIVMLHNITKHDRSFKSKFVQFPSLRRHHANDTAINITTTHRPGDPPPTTTPHPVAVLNPLPKTQDILRDTDEERMDEVDLDFLVREEKVTIVPQVFLQNDQTPIVAVAPENSSTPHVRINHENLPTTTAKSPTRKKLQEDNEDVKNGKKMTGSRRRKKKQPNKVCKEIDDKVIGNCTLATAWSESVGKQRNRKGRKMADGTRNATRAPDEGRGEKKLQRVPRNQRSHTTLENANQPINPANIYTESIDINPSLCHEVGGLSYGQQKLCVLHTNIMPAISRGARSAIQECKHQFGSRRWNCSTVDDDTVFGPITS